MSPACYPRVVGRRARGARLDACLVCIALTSVGMETPARAQSRGETQGAEAPGASLVAPGRADAVDVLPAALATSPGLAVGWTHAMRPWSPDGSDTVTDALRWTQPLFGVAGFGLSMSIARPEEQPAWTTISTALGVRLSSAFSSGLAIRRTSSLERWRDGLVSVDLSARWLPWPALGFAATWRDVGGPVGLGGASVASTFVLAVATRPTGDDALTVELAATADSDADLAARGLIEARVPLLGHAFAEIEWDRLRPEAGADVRIWAGLSLRRSHLSALAAAPWRTDGRHGGYAFGVSWSEATSEGLPEPRVVLDRTVEALDERGVVQLLLDLEAASRDDRVGAVLLRFRGTGLGLAWAQELRQAIAALGARGRPVVCHLDDASGAEHYACAGADAVLLDPAGGIRLTGPHVRTVLIGEALARIGVRAEFVRIGEYKSFPELFTQRSSSDPARTQREALLDDVHRRVVGDYAQDLGVSHQRARQLVTSGPYLAPWAIERGLAWAVADGSDLDDELHRLLGWRASRIERVAPRAPNRWTGGRGVGVVVVDGDIVDGENVDVPFLDVHLSGSETLVRTIDALAADPNVAAIVLRVDSPGGSALAADRIWRAVRRARERKPVVASLGALATSAGYYIASAANEIWASPSTVTGSVGVFWGKVDVRELLDRLGVGVEHVARGPHAGFESPYRPLSARERWIAAEAVRVWYRMFLRRIEAGRGIPVATLHEVARGRLWSGEAARRHHFVDRLGGLQSALARARQLTDLPDDCPVRVLPTRPRHLLDWITGRGAHVRLDPELRRVARAALGLALARPGVAHARLDALVEVR
ncbi:MAG: signal peptide peptidase SppA [Myxococcota bacterium]|nr:signal peptide peptidase SppA [Myxococcota bacterium]